MTEAKKQQLRDMNRPKISLIQHERERRMTLAALSINSSEITPAEFLIDRQRERELVAAAMRTAARTKDAYDSRSKEW